MELIQIQPIKRNDLIDLHFNLKRSYYLTKYSTPIKRKLENENENNQQNKKKLEYKINNHHSINLNNFIPMNCEINNNKPFKKNKELKNIGMKSNPYCDQIFLKHPPLDLIIYSNPNEFVFNLINCNEIKMECE